VPIDPKFREKITGSPEEIRYDPSGFDYTLPGTGEFEPAELYPDREHELCYYLFPNVAGGESGFLARRARARREERTERERLEHQAEVREHAQFKLSSRNSRIAVFSPDESEALHELLVKEVQGWTE
jgi:pyruvate carboxylase subunit B